MKFGKFYGRDLFKHVLSLCVGCVHFSFILRGDGFCHHTGVHEAV
jgi:hypothetical protein